MWTIFWLVILFQGAISYDKDDFKRTNIDGEHNYLHKGQTNYMHRKHMNDFGVKITKRAVIYHGFYFRNLCGRTRFYHEFNVCKKDKMAVINCLTLLSERGLLGRREILINGVHGLDYEFKPGCRKSRVKRRMKSCIHKNGQTSVCLTKLQQQGLIGPGQVFRRLVVYKIKRVKGRKLRTKGHLKPVIKHHIRPISLKFKNGRLIHGGKEYRLQCTQRHFFRVWRRCIHRYFHENVCFRRMKILKIFIPYEEGYYGDEEHINHSIKSVDEYLRQLVMLAKRRAKKKIDSKNIYSNTMSADGSNVHRPYVHTENKTNRKHHLKVVKHTAGKMQNHGYESNEE
ncbi:uncharacterized protein LOC127737520 isoform X1 [Mytilus californianus]|uniref:uncharacterized protein LOC127737520 isoform X1 n=1 Tax=Mytilus californianus TaxID=6549 RepID=UPI00224830DD|nr:uncharacterized protein LOC127737520 isoform X1 [Mytilus californianus]